jgi:predicted GNAT family N-acyltransferase
MAAVMAVRAAVFLGEEDCDFAEEFDGNDTEATHILAFKNGEPAGTIRIRWFGDFARYERLAIRKRHRSLSMANALIRCAIKVSRRRGYTRATGLARQGTEALWCRRGCHVAGEAIATADGLLTPILIPVAEIERDEDPGLDIQTFGSKGFEAALAHASGDFNPKTQEAAHA